MKKKDREDNKQQDKAEIIKTNLDVFPVRFYDEEVGGFCCENGSYINFLEVIPKDRENASEDELQYDMLRLARFYRAYAPDIKWTALNFPLNTSVQRKHKERKLESMNDPVRRKWLQYHINDLNKLDQNITRREFFLIYFGSDKESFVKETNDIMSYIGNGKSALVKPMSKEKRAYIQYKLNNMNSLIVFEENVDYEEE